MFHLLGARDAFLFELNERYGLNLNPARISIGYFKDQLHQKKLKIPEFDTIVNLQEDETSWLYHAKEMRNFSTHVSSLSRSYHVGGPNDQKIWLKNPRSKDIIPAHFVEMFDDWSEKMGSLLLSLRD